VLQGSSPAPDYSQRLDAGRKTLVVAPAASARIPAYPETSPNSRWHSHWPRGAPRGPIGVPSRRGRTKTRPRSGIAAPPPTGCELRSQVIPRRRGRSEDRRPGSPSRLVCLSIPKIGHQPGNSTATVYPMMASGDIAPLRVIRSAEEGKASLRFGKTQAVAYDSTREEVLVPN
jgi:hypothetical protein